jgi:hypothetical protein
VKHEERTPAKTDGRENLRKNGKPRGVPNRYSRDNKELVLHSMDLAGALMESGKVYMYYDGEVRAYRMDQLIPMLREELQREITHREVCMLNMSLNQPADRRHPSAASRGTIGE